MGGVCHDMIAMVSVQGSDSGEICVHCIILYHPVRFGGRENYISVSGGQDSHDSCDWQRYVNMGGTISIFGQLSSSDAVVHASALLPQSLS